MLRLYLYARVHFCLRKSHAGPRVQRAPGLPCALISSRGQQTMQNSDERCRENAKSYSVVIVREGGRSSIPETAVIEPIGRGVLDPPPSRRMTAVCCVAVFTSELRRARNDVERPERTGCPARAGEDGFLRDTPFVHYNLQLQHTHRARTRSTRHHDVLIWNSNRGARFGTLFCWSAGGLQWR